MPSDDINEQASGEAMIETPSNSSSGQIADSIDIQNSLRVYELFRDRIKHQDILISHRVGYFLLMQTGIVTGLGVLRPQPMDKTNVLYLVERVLPSMGWILSIALLLSLFAAFTAIESCVQLYFRMDHAEATLPGVRMLALAPEKFTSHKVIAAMPPLRSSTKVHLAGHAVPWFVVFLSLLFWPIVFAHSDPRTLLSGALNAYWYL